MLRRFNLSLRGPVHNIPAKLKEFMDNVRMYREMYSDWGQEQIFIESTAYLTLLSVANQYPEGLNLRKGEDLEVGDIFGIPAISSVFTPAHKRDEQDVPTLSIQYRMLE